MAPVLVWRHREESDHLLGIDDLLVNSKRALSPRSVRTSAEKLQDVVRNSRPLIIEFRPQSADNSWP